MKFSRTIALLLIALAVWWSYKALMPAYNNEPSLPLNEFSVDRALDHVKQLSNQPHAVGFQGHDKAQAYIIAELKEMGLETNTQEGYTAGDWGNLSKATNIMARIKGTEEGKALLLLSHYDSSPHSSLGASDAASGVATILEGIRAFMAENKASKNDIIILITDAEELGLNGADLFVNRHPWAAEVGLVLNFEARGSGGPSYMLIETNRGNGKLIKEFQRANPKFPVANSLAYSIYKMLPNDTDLTVFREDADIDGFNFAFIDDHFDYHTVLDNYDRLDRNSLAHQGSYLMPLLSYFSQADLNNLKSHDDYVYFNVPFFKLIMYPFEWIWPMFVLGCILFIVLLIIGFKKGVLNAKDVMTGFVPPVLALILCGLIGYITWPILKWWYPGFNDMLHGFPYQGHTYILAFALLSLGICFWLYHHFDKMKTPNLLVAPLFIWLLISGLSSHFLSGASFFIIPVFGLLASLFVYIKQKNPNSFLMVFFALPAVFIYAPFIKMFPVGLGLKMLMAATLFVVLLFMLVLPLFAQIKNKWRFAVLFMLLFAIFSITAHINSGFTEDSPKPSSLLYVLDGDQKTARWATYDQQLTGWNSQFFADDKQVMDENDEKTISSKYSSGFSYMAEALVKQIAIPTIDIEKDTVFDGQRKLKICVAPKRKVNRLDVFTNEVPISQALINGQALSGYFLENRRNGKLITHYISNNDYTEIELTLSVESPLELSFFESSNDLLHNDLFSIPERPENNIPMPFVLNDAIMTINTIRFE